uniref:Uncharacterized protein n=1 Tax=Callithrix jacchus TaxID=9483 RepID=A0A8I3WJ86_CALJA
MRAVTPILKMKKLSLAQIEKKTVTTSEWEHNNKNPALIFDVDTFKIPVYPSGKGLISRIYKELKQIYKKKNKPIQKWVKDMNRYFAKENIHEANQNKNKCSLSLVIREMQIKTTLRYHLTPVRTAIIKKSGDNRCWRGCGKIGVLLHCWWECKLVQPLWKTVWRFLKDLEIEIPFDPAILLLGIYPKDY